MPQDYIVYSQFNGDDNPLQVAEVSATEAFFKNLASDVKLTCEGAYIFNGYLFVPHLCEDCGDYHCFAFKLPDDYDDTKHRLWIDARQNVELYEGNNSGDYYEAVLVVKEK